MILHQIDTNKLNFSSNKLSKASTDLNNISVPCAFKGETTNDNITLIRTIKDTPTIVKKISQLSNSETMIQEIDNYMNDSHIFMFYSVKIKTSIAMADNVMLSTIKWYWAVLVIVAPFLFIIKMFLWQYSTIRYKQICKKEAY